MTVFKTFWQVVKKYKGTIILYTVMLIIFGGLNMNTSETSIQFVDSKPDVFIVNQDEEIGLTKNLIHYMEKNSNIVELKNNEEALNDALFYRDVNYIIYIPKNYRDDVLRGVNPTIDIKSTGDYQSSLAEMFLSRYIQIQNVYLKETKEENQLIESINHSLSNKSNIEVTSTINETENSKVATYFNFASYSIMAVVIFIICLVISSFKNQNINKRTIISSMKYQKFNRNLLVASFLYALIVWILFVLLGVVLLRSSLFTVRGVIFSINAFLFTGCSLTIALLISTIVSNKEAISGIVNVIALGSAFLCGAFVPAEWLPESVLRIAHVLPAYWYINSNNLLKSLETISFETLQPIIINGFVMIGFSIFFVIMNNIVSNYKRKIG